MIVHRILDAFFRTLDAVDAARDRVDRALGREPRPDPWAVEWPPADADLPHKPEAEPRPSNGAAPAEATPQAEANKPVVPVAPKADPQKPAAKKAPGAKTAARPKTAKPKASKGAKAAKGRKGSVDRSGKDFDSPRARAIDEFLTDEGRGVVTEDAELGGKKVLGRVLWALLAADEAGSAKGLTTADASALLSLAADIEVYATNIGRACRDHDELIMASEPDGRSKRYRLTDAGMARAKDIETRAR